MKPAYHSCSQTSQNPDHHHEVILTTDQDIIERIRGGETRLYALILDRHKDRAMTLAMRLVGDREEAEELLQDAFVRAYRNLDQFRGDAKFGTWFYRILYNLCMTRVTRRKPRAESLDAQDESMRERMLVDPDDLSVVEKMENDELQDIIGSELHNLPERYKAAMTFFYVQEMGYDDISEVLGIPVGTVKTYLFRGRNILKERVLRKVQHQEKVA